MTATVFILGAGASHEINLPTGDRLTKTIADMLNIRLDVAQRPEPVISGDRQIVEALRHHSGGRSLDPYIAAGRRIHAGMPIASSIDTFLDAHRGDAQMNLCGKLSIVRAILEAEKNSGLYRDIAADQVPLSMERVGTSWFKWFWRLLSDGCTAGEITARARSVTFVVFNYDRCLEQFLHHAARAYYDLPSDEAVAAMSGIRIFHPYGSIAPLPWQEHGGIDYGTTEIAAPMLLELSKRVMTFTEVTEPGDEYVEAMRLAVNSADRIVFLGFAFHRQNMRLLWPEKVPSRDAYVYGTAKGFSLSDIQFITNDIATQSGSRGPFALRDLSCNELFHEYSRSLALS